MVAGMNRERTRAYTRLMGTLEDVGPAKLLSPELARIRFTADSLLFCADIARDVAARRAYADVIELCDHLVSSARWTVQAAERLQDELWACGPGLPAAQALAA
jgi:hypothetical protein